MNRRSIFIAATGQNIGKTTLCLGIIAGLSRRYGRVGFLKPVGQQHATIDNNVKIDKDAVLFKTHFNLPFRLTDMSPVIIPPGFTRDFIDGHFSEKTLLKKIHSSFQTISQQNDYTVVEGTGHVGVGSIIDLNNAKVAAALGLDMVIVVSGGLGSAIDELALNIAMCERYGVHVRGVILNRVLDHKREMILDYFPRALKKWGIPLIGCVPFNVFLNSPALRDFESLFHTTLLSGEEHHYRHFHHFRLVACSLSAYKEEMTSNELVITPATRTDIIEATLEHAKDSGGMILTGKHPPGEKMIKRIQSAGVPTLYVPLCSYDAMKMITSYKAKIRIKDHSKIKKAIQVVEDAVHFDTLCRGNDKQELAPDFLKAQ
ncbi:MAG: AAA family ATPase [Waddliaceae bacterium]